MDDHASSPGSPEPPSATPLWVKVLGGVILVLGLLIVAMLILGGEHGPGRHMPPGGYDSRGATAHSTVEARALEALFA